MKIIPIPYGRARELCFPSPRSLRTLELELLLSPLSRSRSRCLFLTAKRHSTPFVLRKLTEASLNHEREVSNGPDRPLSLSVLSRFSPRPNRGGGGRNDLNRKTVESSSSSSQSLPLSSPRRSRRPEFDLPSSTKIRRLRKFQYSKSIIQNG